MVGPDPFFRLHAFSDSVVFRHDRGKPVGFDSSIVSKPNDSKARGCRRTFLSLFDPVDSLFVPGLVSDNELELVAVADYRRDLGDLHSLVWAGLRPGGLRAGRGKTQSVTQKKAKKGAGSAGDRGLVSNWKSDSFSARTSRR